MIIHKEQLDTTNKYQEYKKKIIRFASFIKYNLIASDNRKAKDILKILGIQNNSINNFKNVFDFIYGHINKKEDNKKIINYFNKELSKSNIYKLSDKEKLLVLYVFIFYYLKDIEYNKTKIVKNTSYCYGRTEGYLNSNLMLLHQTKIMFDLILNEYKKTNNQNINILLKNFYSNSLSITINYQKYGDINNKEYNFVINNFIKIYLKQNDIILNRINEKNINDNELIEFVKKTYSKDLVIKLFINKNLSNFFKTKRVLEYLFDDKLKSFFYLYYDISKEQINIFQNLNIDLKFDELDYKITEIFDISKTMKIELKNYFLSKKISPNIKTIRTKIANDFVKYFFINNYKKTI